MGNDEEFGGPEQGRENFPAGVYRIRPGAAEDPGKPRGADGEWTASSGLEQRRVSAAGTYSYQIRM